MPSESTRTLLFGLLVVVDRPLTSGQIVALAKPLGISATNVKSHLTRLVRAGVLRRTGRKRFAQYSPAAAGDDRIQAISARLDSREDHEWDGDWLLLALRPPAARQERRHVRESLWSDGFRPWSSDIFLRPAWPKPWAVTRAEAHVRAGRGICVQGALLGVVDRRRVRALYRLDALDRSAARLAKEIDAKRRDKHSAAEAFAARLNVGGQVARLVGHDPRLPTALWESRTGLRDLRNAYRRFEEHVSAQAQAFVDRVITPKSRHPGTPG